MIIMSFEEVYAQDPEPLKLPPSPVKAIVLDCSFHAGWCSKNSSIRFVVEDPLLPIIGIAGTRNGVDFYCDDIRCSWPLSLGENFLVYWSVSPFGELSEKKVLSVFLSLPLPRSVVKDDKKFDQPVSRRTLSLTTPEQIVLTQYKTVVNPGSTIKNPDHFKSIKTDSEINIYLPKVVMDLPKGNISQMSFGVEKIDSANIYKTLFHAQMFIAPFFANKEGSINQELDLANNKITESRNLSKTSALSGDLENKILFIIKTHQKNNFKKAISSILVKEEYLANLDNAAPKVTIEKQKVIKGEIVFEGEIYEDVSDISNLMINFGQGWLPVRYENNKWAITWDTEKEDISGDEFVIQVRSTDLAGNTSIQYRKITVINRLWPVLALCCLVIMLGVVAVFDPRRTSWVNLAHTIEQGIAIQKLNSMEKEE